MKCPLCGGSGEHIFILENQGSELPIQVRGPCTVCNGSGEVPIEIVKQQLDTWLDSSFKVLLQILNLDKSEPTIQEQNVVLFLHMELERVATRALDLVKGYHP